MVNITDVLDPEHLDSLLTGFQEPLAGQQSHISSEFMDGKQIFIKTLMVSCFGTRTKKARYLKISQSNKTCPGPKTPKPPSTIPHSFPMLPRLPTCTLKG